MIDLSVSWFNRAMMHTAINKKVTSKNHIGTYAYENPKGVKYFPQRYANTNPESLKDLSIEVLTLKLNISIVLKNALILQDFMVRSVVTPRLPLAPLS